MPTAFSDRLAEAVLSKQSRLVVGLDPDLDRIPLDCRQSRDVDPREAAADALTRFSAGVIDAVAAFACGVKLQSAYYEAWGPAGISAYESTIEHARAAGLLVIGDVKRGDIGTTAEAYARAHLLGPHTPDAITVNPYLGTDGVLPFLLAARRSGKGVFVLVRTSNPSATELQDLVVEGEPVHARVASLVNRWSDTDVDSFGYSGVGAVVGATVPRELMSLRRAMPRSWFLVPGVGAQGATARDVAGAFDSRGLGAIVNSSRGIIYAFSKPDGSNWRSEIKQAASALRSELQEVVGKPGT